MLLWIYSVDSLLCEIVDLWLEAALQEAESQPRAASLASPSSSSSSSSSHPLFYLRYGMARAGAKLVYSNPNPNPNPNPTPTPDLNPTPTPNQVPS